MSEPADAQPNFRSHLTLFLCTILHAFTHAYGTLLVPLYLLMVNDLRLRGVCFASAVVSVYGILYCAECCVAGKMSDMYIRKMLLGNVHIAKALAMHRTGL